MILKFDYKSCGMFCSPLVIGYFLNKNAMVDLSCLPGTPVKFIPHNAHMHAYDHSKFRLGSS